MRSNHSEREYEEIRLKQTISLAKEQLKSCYVGQEFPLYNEILNFSAKFIGQSPQIKSFNWKGDIPEVFIADNSKVLVDKIVKSVPECSIDLAYFVKKRSAHWYI